MKTTHYAEQEGFSLVEAMVAMVILSIGLLAVGLMQIGGMKANTNALSRGDGVAIAQSTMDVLRCLPFDDTRLSDSNTAASNLDDGKANGSSAPDPSKAAHTGDEIYTSNPLKSGNGQVYDVFWNVDDDTPTTGAKTIRLFVYWTDNKFGRNHVTMTSVLGGNKL